MLDTKARLRFVTVLASLVVLGLAWGALVEGQSGQASGTNPRSQRSTPPESFSTRVVATGLESPWEVIWGPDGFLWVTERVGQRVVRINPSDGTRHVALTIDDVYQSVGQDGLLGMALDPGLLRGSNYVYVFYTYDAQPGADVLRRATIRRYTYDPVSEQLRDPLDVIRDLPHGSDHGGGRLLVGPDSKLYVSRGDHGANFGANYCLHNRAQDLPSAADIRAGQWDTYQGKILRLNLDGSIPNDNPVLAGVRSHVYSYGHRNPQGLVFAPDGRLYASEHGQDTDDEVNRIEAGRNYGWPFIAGFKDDQYYVYANWSAASPTPCAALTYSRSVPASVPRTRESEVNLSDFAPPLKTFFTVPSTYDQSMLGNATAAPAGVDVYTSTTIPGWRNSLLVTAMVSGVIFRMPLAAGQAPLGTPATYFRSRNRFRDLAIAPDGRRIFLITDSGGRVVSDGGALATDLENPGALLEFTYAGTRGN